MCKHLPKLCFVESITLKNPLISIRDATNIDSSFADLFNHWSEVSEMHFTSYVKEVILFGETSLSQMISLDYCKSNTL